MEIKKLMDDFLLWKEIRGYSPATIKKERPFLRQVLHYLEEHGVRQIEDLRQEVLESFQEDLVLRPPFAKSSSGKAGRLFLSPSVRKNYLGMVKLFLTWLKKKDFLAGDLSEVIVYPRGEKRLPRHILSLKEVEELLELPDTTTPLGFRARVILELLYATGIRCQELTRLKVRDVDLERELLYILEGKGKKDRLVPLGPGVCQILKHYLDFVRPKFLGNRKSHDYLFPGQGDKPLSTDTIHDQVHSYAQKSTLKKRLTPHALRHTCATHMLQNGAPIRSVQELLGHSQLNTTQIYTHVTINDLKKAHKKYHPRERMLKEKTIEKKGGISDNENHGNSKNN